MRALACLALCAGVFSASGSFRCVDSSGKTHIGDAPPAACVNVTTYEVSPAGSVVRRIDPPSSQPQIDKGSQANQADERRRDRALLDSYTKVEEIDSARDRNLEMIRSQIDATRGRIDQLGRREKELERSIGAYGNAGAPQPLRADLESVRAETASLTSAQLRFEKNLDSTKSRFEEDRRRWLELRGNR